MSQTSYSTTLASAFAGMKADSRFDVVESAVANVNINYGRGISNKAGEDDVHMSLRDVGIITMDADFSADNVVTVTVNGVAAADVTYATSHAATATALLAAIAAHPAVTAVTKNAAGRVWTISTKGTVNASSMSIVGGTFSGTSGYSVTDYVTGQDSIFRGISLHRHNEVGYTKALEVLDIVRKGVVWVETSATVVADAAAYVDMAGGLGKFTSTSSNNLATGGVFRSSVTGAGLAKLEINLP